MLFNWIAEHMQICVYIFILALVLGIANKTGNAGNRACKGMVSRGSGGFRKALFVILITGVLLVSLSQGWIGAFFDAVLAAKVYQQTGDISQPLIQREKTPSGDWALAMTPFSWIMVALFVVSVFVLVIASGADRVLAGDYDD